MHSSVVQKMTFCSEAESALLNEECADSTKPNNVHKKGARGWKEVFGGAGSFHVVVADLAIQCSTSIDAH